VRCLNRDFQDLRITGIFEPLITLIFLIALIFHAHGNQGKEIIRISGSSFNPDSEPEMKGKNYVM